MHLLNSEVKIKNKENIQLCVYEVGKTVDKRNLDH